MATFAARAYEHPDETAGVHEARERFFHAVHRVEPRVSTDLMGEPLALYRSFYREYKASRPLDRFLGWTWAMELGWLPGWSYFQYANDAYDPPSYVQIRDLLLKWSKRWRLPDPWCLEAAVETLAMMSASDDDPTQMPLYYLGTRMVKLPFAEDETVFSFESKGWYLTLESWDWAEERIRDKFNRELRAYRERMERLAHEEGLAKARQRRNRDVDPFNALARYAPGWETSQEIADSLGVSRQAVDDALNRIKHLIGLTTPPHKP